MMRLMLIMALSLVLSACGGGGGSAAPPPPPPTATAQDLADAQAAKLTGNLEAATQLATLTWSDTFPAGTTYNIEQQAADGAWSPPIDSVPGNNGSGATLTWTRTTSVSTVFRVAAQRTGYEVPLVAPSGYPGVNVWVTAPPTIQFNQVPPLEGAVQVSIIVPTQFGSVSYYVDSVDTGPIAPGSVPQSVPVGFDTGSITNGSHDFIAHLASGPDFYVDVRRTVQVANTSGVSVQTSITGTTGTVFVLVDATSTAGTASATVSLDGNALGSLTAPNSCHTIESACNFAFRVDADAAGSGSHTITAQATDTLGTTASQTILVVFENPPTVTLASPFDGQIVNGTLQVAGTFAGYTTASLNLLVDGVSILTASASPFSTSFDFASLTPGDHNVTATVTDNFGVSTTVNNIITVTSSPSLVYTPLFTLGSGGTILDASGTYVLYSTGVNGTIHLHSGSDDSTVPVGTIQNLGNWKATDAGDVFANGIGSDRPGSLNSVYMWPPGGAAQNLSIAAGSTGSDQVVQASYPWVLWLSDTSGYVLYNVTTGQQYNGFVPGGGGSPQAEFVSLNGQLSMVYTVTVTATDGTQTTNVFRWDQATNTSVPLTTDGLSDLPQTDGVRVAWYTNQVPQVPGFYTLTTLDLASQATHVLSTNMSEFQLADGLLAWLDYRRTSPPIPLGVSVSDGTNTSFLTTTNFPTSSLWSSGGYVFYVEGNELYAWSVAGGRQLLFNGPPGQPHVTGKTVYFTNGLNQVVYSVTLP